MPAHSRDRLDPVIPRRVVVFGTGAMASLFGARLAASPSVDVTLTGTWQAAIDEIASDGITLVDGEDEWTVPAAAAPLGQTGVGADLVVVLTKAYRTRAIAPHAARAVGAGGAVLTLQNGLGNPEALAEHIGVRRVVVGVTSMGASLLAPGRVRLGGTGDTVLGPVPAGSRVPPAAMAPSRDAATASSLGQGPDGAGVKTTGSDQGGNSIAQAAAKRHKAHSGASPAAAALVLTAAGFPTRVVSDMLPHVWLKLAVNCAINPLSALLHVPNGALLSEPQPRATLERAAREAGRVAAAAGIDLGEDPAEAAVRVARLTSANRSSMLQDLERGAPTEIEAITGAVVAAARRLGTRTPVNEYLYGRIRMLEETGHRPASIFDELAHHVD